MAKNNSTNILKEHDKVYGARYKFSILTFIAVFISSIVTLVFVGKKGIADTMLLFLYIMAIASCAQVVLLIVDYALQKFSGKYVKALTISSYIVALVWIVALVGEFVLGSLQVSALRIDLLVILGIQFALALTAYFLFPFMNRSFLSSMISKKMRDDSQEKSRRRKAGRQVFIYALFAILFVCLQAVTLLAYKIPPRFYDIFEDTRALSYTLTEDESGYVVSGMYMGTSSKVVVPATYNEKPVVGIKSGALVDDGLLEKYKIREITLGTYTTDAEGNQVLESNIHFIEGGAISSDRIQNIVMPETIEEIGSNAISSQSLKKVVYSCSAGFDINYLQCPNLESIIMKGDNVGQILSIVGLPQNCYITIAREIYDDYRRENPLYADNFRPDIGADEYCVDFYTDCNDSYINSIINPIGTPVTISIDDLVDTKNRSYRADTLAYITNRTEIGTNGVKANSAFRGWYFDKEFTSECVFSSQTNSITISSDAALHAKWIEEYTATLNWSTYTPRNNEVTWDDSDNYHIDDSKITKVHYTEDHVIDFPVVSGRLGYADGIAWSYNGQSVTNSSEIEGNVNLVGSWLLDAPEVSIDTSNRVGDDFSGYGNGVTFTFGFNELSGEINRRLYLAPDVSHDINVSYTYYWKRNNQPVDANSSHAVEIKRVSESGDYTLTVQARSVTGETSVFTSEPVSITVNKKNIENDVITLEYDVNGIEYGSDESLVTDIKNANDFANQYDTEYEYSKKQSDGTYVSINIDENTVLDVGEYKVDVRVVRKDEYANDYNPKVWSATPSINRREISITWEGDSFTYNGEVQSPTARIENDFGLETINNKVAYIALTSIDVDDYVAEIYFLDGMEKNLTIASGSSLTKEFSITPLALKVDRWELDGRNVNTLQYLGRDVEVKAYPNVGDIPSRDADNVFFSFTGSSIDIAKNVSTDNLVEVNYIVDSEGVKNNNYTIDVSDDNNTFTWSITKAALTAYQPTSANNYVYSGQEQNLQIYIDGFLGTDAQDALFTDFDQENFISKERINSNRIALSMTGKDAGSSYSATLNAFNNDNYELAGTGTYNFTINKKVLVLGENTNDNNVTYSGNKVSRNFVLSGFIDGEVQNFDKDSLVYENDGDFEINSTTDDDENAVTFTFTTPSKNVGVYTVAITGIKAGLQSSDVLRNYAWPTSAEGEVNVSITPKVVEFNWFIQNDKLSGGASVAFTNNYAYNGKTYTASAMAKNLVAGDVVEATCADNTILNAGNCFAKVTAITGTDAENYTIVGSSTINKSFVLNKKTVSVSWQVSYGTTVEEYDSTKSYTYDKIAYTLQPIINGIEAGDECGASSYDSNINTNLGASALEGDRNRATNAGVYNIKVASLDNANYTLPATQSYAVLKINKKVVAFEWKISNNYDESIFDETQTYTYNKNSYSLSANITNKCDGDIVNVNYSAQGQSLTNAGSTTVTIVSLYGSSADNYVLPTVNVEKQLVVAKKVLEFTFIDKAVTYSNNTNAIQPTDITVCSGDSVEFTYSSNVVDNYGQSNITRSENEATRAGRYRVIITGTTNNNYTIEGTASDLEAYLTINKKEVEITSWNNTSFIYNANKVHPTPVLSGVCYNDVVNVTYVSEDFENAGTHTIHANGISGANSSNYVFKNVNTSCDFDITKRVVTLNWSNVGQYNGQTQVPSLISVSNDAGLFNALTGYAGHTTAKFVGDYAITAVFNDDIVNNFEINGIEKSFTITPRVVEIAWTGSTNVTYNAAEHTLSAVVTNNCLNNGDSVRVEYVAENGYTNAGEYDITISNLVGANSFNYTIAGASDLSRTLIINKRTVEFDWELDGSAYNGQSITYDKGAHTLEAREKNLCAGDSVTITYSIPNDEFVNAGTYTIRALVSGNDNYVASSANYTEITINKKELAFDWKLDGDSFNGQSIVYNGNAHTITAHPNNVCFGDSVTISYYSANTFKDAGSNLVRVYSINNSNYQLPSNASVIFEITKKPVSIVWDSANSFVYSASSYAANATINGVYPQDTNVALSYTIKNTSTGSTSNGNSATNAGSYLVTASLSHTNYMLSTTTTKTKSFTIAQKEVTLNWQLDGAEYISGDLIYDAQNHALSAQIVGLESSDQGYVNVVYYTNQSGKTVGTNTTTVTGLSGSKSANYVIDNSIAKTKSFTISPKEVTLNWTLDGDDFVSGDLTYDAQNHTLTAEIVGLKSADQGYVNVVYYTNPSGRTVGTYTTTITGLGGTKSANYVLSDSTEKTKSFTISPKEVMLNWTLDGDDFVSGDLVYDGQYHMISAEIVGIESSDQTSVNVVYSSNQTARAVGTYTTTITGLGGTKSANYLLVDSVEKTKTLTISPREVTLSWNNSTPYVYNGYSQYPTATVNSGVATGDILDITYDSYDFVNVGSYTISVVSTDSNYEILNASCDFEIVECEIVLSWDYSAPYVYTGVRQYPTATIESSMSTGTMTITYDSNNFVNAGSYTISVVAPNSNYKIINQSCDFEIMAKEITVDMVGGPTFEYDGTTKSVNITCSEPSKSMLSIEGTTRTAEVGVYTITVQSNSDNYIITGENEFTWKIIENIEE